MPGKQKINSTTAGPKPKIEAQAITSARIGSATDPRMIKLPIMYFIAYLHYKYTAFRRHCQEKKATNLRLGLSKGGHLLLDYQIP